MLPSHTRLFTKIVNEALEKAWVIGFGTNLLDCSDCYSPGVALIDPNFTRDRALLRISRGGAGIRLTSDRHLFLRSICTAIQQFLDSSDGKEITTKGLFHDQLVSVIGEDSFNHANSSERWTHFLATDSIIASEFKQEWSRAKHIRDDLTSKIDWSPNTKKPQSVFDKPIEGFASDTRKHHNAIMDERRALLAILLDQRAAKLPQDDPRRMAYYANSADAFAKKPS
jgi:hypothetical protein